MGLALRLSGGHNKHRTLNAGIRQVRRRSLFYGNCQPRARGDQETCRLREIEKECGELGDGDGTTQS